MKSPVLPAVGLALAVGAFSGCNGSDGPSIASNSPPTAAATDDQRIPQSDTLTAAETAQINQANAEPTPTAKPDL